MISMEQQTLQENSVGCYVIKFLLANSSDVYQLCRGAEAVQ